ncbi:hydroxyproline O-galactosyltransferase GALT3-like [Syzygium oleosum]|uniref:hydroxyproline O-galactosyltransferase GALT3-like n=1 Tax=Syzygium oleosum TaxID=219896 RepID=UPI0011D21979|nr:hydroxyproline O-galactosyltransferase GALT3-like [Syzygium oleosum]
MKQRSIFLVMLNSSVILAVFVIFLVLLNAPIRFLFTASPENAFKVDEALATSGTRFSLLIGVLTRPNNYDRRHFLRLVYGIQSSPVAEVQVKFVFCSVTNPEQKIFLALEILRFNDIIILNCTENMNFGKTYTYFSSLPDILPRRFDYVMKADDDVYIRLAQLVSSLQPLPRQDLYYGFVLPCPSMNPHEGYMSGMGFALSWDLVEWIASSEIPKHDTFGPEDKLVGRWLNKGKKARNRFTSKPAMYDYPGTNGRCSHELVPDTVAVHRLKRWDRWLRVLEFFNVTKELNHSKLYNL